MMTSRLIASLALSCSPACVAVETDTSFEVSVVETSQRLTPSMFVDLDPEARIVQVVESHVQGGRVFMRNGPGSGDQRGQNEGNGGCGLMVNEGGAEGTRAWSWSILTAGVHYRDQGASNQLIENQGNGGFAVQHNHGAELASAERFTQRRIDPYTLELELAGEQQAYYLKPTRCRLVIDLVANHSQLMMGTGLTVSTGMSELTGGIGNVNANFPARDGSNSNNNNNANLDGTQNNNNNNNSTLITGSAASTSDNNNNNNNNSNVGGLRNNNNSNSNSMFAGMFPGGLSVNVKGDRNQVAFAYGAGASMQLRDETTGTWQLRAPTVLELPDCPPPLATRGNEVIVEGSGNQVVLQEGNASGILQKNREQGGAADDLRALLDECPAHFR